jgi:hypothetical protein
VKEFRGKTTKSVADAVAEAIGAVRRLRRELSQLDPGSRSVTRARKTLRQCAVRLDRHRMGLEMLRDIAAAAGEEEAGRRTNAAIEQLLLLEDEFRTDPCPGVGESLN